MRLNWACSELWDSKALRQSKRTPPVYQEPKKLELGHESRLSISGTLSLGRIRWVGHKNEMLPVTKFLADYYSNEAK